MFFIKQIEESCFALWCESEDTVGSLGIKEISFFGSASEGGDDAFILGSLLELNGVFDEYT